MLFVFLTQQPTCWSNCPSLRLAWISALSAELTDHLSEHLIASNCLSGCINIEFSGGKTARLYVWNLTKAGPRGYLSVWQLVSSTPDYLTSRRHTLAALPAHSQGSMENFLSFKLKSLTASTLLCRLDIEGEKLHATVIIRARGKLATASAEMDLSPGEKKNEKKNCMWCINVVFYFFILLGQKMLCKALTAVRGSGGWISHWDNVQQSFFLCMLSL